MAEALSAIEVGLSGFLLLNVLAGLARMSSVPEPVDRMMIVQLLGTLGIAVVLLLGAARDVEALLDVALVLAVLAAVLAATFARRYAGRPDDRPEGEAGDDP